MPHRKSSKNPSTKDLVQEIRYACYIIEREINVPFQLPLQWPYDNFWTWCYIFSLPCFRRFEQCMSQGSFLTTCILRTANIFPRALKEIYMCTTIQHVVTHGTVWFTTYNYSEDQCCFTLLTISCFLVTIKTFSKTWHGLEKY